MLITFMRVGAVGLRDVERGLFIVPLQPERETLSAGHLSEPAGRTYNLQQRDKKG